MSVALLSEQWHRVAGLRPRLVPHARVHRHVTHGAVWHVLEDVGGARQHRLNAQAYRVLRLLDGRHSLDQIWQRISREISDDTPSQDDVLQLVGQLNAQDLLVVDATPDAAELLVRHERQQRQKRRQSVGNPMSIKIPLWDPDSFLRRLLAVTPAIPAALVWAAWLGVVGTALALVPAHWPDLSRNFGEQMLAANNLLLAALVYPLLKLAHELAHGAAVIRRGGEVHEMGVMLLMFYPSPYVDASASNAFPSRWARMRVAAAGMVVELWIAALAFFLWMAIEPGFWRSVLYNLMVLGSVSTVLFNGNPLLRFDGYFMLADAIGVPNLSQRATAFWQFLLRRFVLGARGAKMPPASRYELGWLAAYAPLALVYRLTVSFGIAWFVAQQYFFVGVLLAAWSLATSVVWPLGKGLFSLWSSPQFAARPWRAWGAVIGGVALLLGLLLALPLPRHVRVQGIAWLPEEAILRARADGFVQTIAAHEGAAVQPGDMVVATHNADLVAKVAEQTGRLALAQARLDAAWVSQPAVAARMQEEVNAEEAALVRAQADVADLQLRAGVPGTVRLEQAQDLPGRYVKRGDMLGYVIGASVPLVRVALTQAEAELDLADLRGIEVRMAGAVEKTYTGRLARSTPQASHNLPSAALGATGGGKFAVDPRDETGATAMETAFQFDIETPDTPTLGAIGTRAYVALEQSPEAIGWRWWRHARRLFLAHLNI
ncbi:hypothetical protein RD110_09045 [Rhodoferax koreense]|uniref:Peptidase M50 n=1 Tax=Rhodoferax koreensis TaxID=1842727 RepID=A0A1P8JU72_9BURK|nr:PqqD family peptide modification chaperone [Rhodoferax koreense]APW37320.1 hypothetical protein RD110_09045 [Rhodoferax koreense]